MICKLKADLQITIDGERKTIPLGSLVNLHPEQAQKLLATGRATFMAANGEELNVPELVTRLAALLPEQTEVFNGFYEDHRANGMGREAAAFLAFCELAG